MYLPVINTTILRTLLLGSAYEGECVVWTGLRSKKGYGRVSINGTQFYVHRVAWVEWHGPISDETPDVLHHCDNPPCWRDDHLFLGTNNDNIADMMAKGRHRHADNQLKTQCPSGHLYDAANTRITPTGKRVCRYCQAEAAKQYRKRQKEKNQ